MDEQTNQKDIMAYLETRTRSISGSLEELFATHPMLFRRIEQIREYAQTPEYRRLQTGMNRNLTL